AAEHVLRTGYAHFPQGPFLHEIVKLRVQQAAHSNSGEAKQAMLNLASAMQTSIAKHEPTGEELFLLYQLYATAGDLRRAADYLQQAATLNPEWELELVKLKALRGRPDDAYALAQRIRAQCLEVLKTYPHHRALRLRAATA